MKQGVSLQELVDAYCSEPTDSLRHTIIEKSTPLVRSIAGKINRPNHPLCEFEDIESAGIMGLIQALNSYNPENNNQFNTYAYYRIRGSIIDYLRKIDALPRSHRSGLGKVQETMDHLQQKLGRNPTDEEIATYLNIPVQEYLKLLVDVQQRAILSLHSSSGDMESGGDLFTQIHDFESPSPDSRLDNSETLKLLEHHLLQLKERDRLIVTLYYYEDLTLSEIGLVVGVTEARISQILGQTLLKLKSVLKKKIDVYSEL
ncbi:MAG: FliA/WhiG family RNA polymerase sigma factor [Balneolaceae bacterium]|nr:MAG: FliA/WhiG family RNA polymerase sigma factor [Balneolaceae bacterium]